MFRFPELASDYNRVAAERLGGGAVRLTYLGLPGTNHALQRTPAIASRLQADALVGRVAELGSFGDIAHLMQGPYAEMLILRQRE